MALPRRKCKISRMTFSEARGYFFPNAIMVSLNFLPIISSTDPDESTGAKRRQQCTIIT